MDKYLSLFRVSFKQAWSKKANLSGMLFFLFILIFIYNCLWEAIAAESMEKGLNRVFIWYLLFAEMIILSNPKIDRILFDDIQSGTMAYYMNKPVSFFFMRYTEALGNMSVSFLIMGGFGAVITLLLTGNPPFEWWQFPIIFMMCFASSCINVLLYTAVGLCGLWLASIRTLGMAVERLAFILGGAIFPLSIYPDWFVDIAKWTPFYSFYYLSIKLVYDFSWSNLAEAFLLNTFWVMLMSTFVVLTYKKLTKRVNVYGG